MKQRKAALAVVSLLCVLMLLTSCTDSKMRKYYAEKDNYITVTGTVTHLKYNEAKTVLYIGFSDLNTRLDDNTFKIEGKNFSIVEENGIGEKIQLGDTVEFVTAPRYFGDGYIMPIVAISAHDETLLTFEEGFPNYLEFLGVR